jgi:broad specificity phosphatase PhoE
MQTVIHLLRHGEVYNPEKIIYGRLPRFNLSENGRKMAEVIAEAVDDPKYNLQSISQIISSPMIRAIQTGEPIAQKLGLDISTDERLIESGSYFAGKKISLKVLLKATAKNYLRDPALPSWGEPYRWVLNRMLDIINQTKEERSGKTTLLVSHQLPIWLTRLHFEQRRIWPHVVKRQCTLASLTSLYFDAKTGEFTQLKYFEPAGFLLKNNLKKTTQNK